MLRSGNLLALSLTGTFVDTHLRTGFPIRRYPSYGAPWRLPRPDFHRLDNACLTGHAAQRKTKTLQIQQYQASHSTSQWSVVRLQVTGVSCQRIVQCNVPPLPCYNARSMALPLAQGSYIHMRQISCQWPVTMYIQRYPLQPELGRVIPGQNLKSTK